MTRLYYLIRQPSPFQIAPSFTAFGEEPHTILTIMYVVCVNGSDLIAHVGRRPFSVLLCYAAGKASSFND